MQHTIRTQIIQLTLDNGLDAFRIQQKVSGTYWDKIVPALSRAFDEVSDENELISLDRIEIDLGLLSEREGEMGNWDEKVYKSIMQQLTVIKDREHGGPGISKQSVPLGFAEQWIYYMRESYVRWDTTEINESWRGKVLEAFAAESNGIAGLRNLLLNLPNAVKRVVRQHSDNFLKSLVEVLTGIRQADLPNLLLQLSSIELYFSKSKESGNIFSERRLAQILWEQVLKISARSNGKFKTNEFIGLLLRYRLTKAQLRSKAVRNFLAEHKISLSEPAAELSDHETENIKKAMSKKNGEKVTETNIDSDGDDLNEFKKIPELKEGIFVSNAGIVLMHPFLAHFFENLKLLEDGRFKDASSRMKALYLLHYLATGNTKPEEHELVIAKVLCGVPLSDPVDVLIETTDEELREAGSVLKAAIAQWDILKGTSPDGLREGFLRRKGKLFTANDNLILQVEQSSIDVLLDRLPWNLSIIKLPWNEGIIRVEWR